ncbi:hypothetical protein [Arthrobacter sp. NPDC090010]|uniref:hypothetical protein n=1 Tax=Arthrobacter sp. NPDC090010 TaxID=3363942 RepID=UPI0037F775A5
MQIKLSELDDLAKEILAIANLYADRRDSKLVGTQEILDALYSIFPEIRIRIQKFGLPAEFLDSSIEVLSKRSDNSFLIKMDPAIERMINSSNGSAEAIVLSAFDSQIQKLETPPENWKSTGGLRDQLIHDLRSSILGRTNPVRSPRINSAGQIKGRIIFPPKSENETK